MKKYRYKDQNKENYKKNIIFLFVMIFILMCANGILNIIENKNQENNKEILYDEISSIREVIEYYKSIYVSEYESTEKNFYLDVDVIFAKPLYENDMSNEEYFSKLIEDCAKVIRYRNFRLIDFYKQLL